MQAIIEAKRSLAEGRNGESGSQNPKSHSRRIPQGFRCPTPFGVFANWLPSELL